MRIPRNFLRSFAVFLLGLATLDAWGAPGDVINKLLTPFPSGSSSGVRPIVLPDGKILIVGYAFNGTQQFAVTRLNADGSVDTSYGALHDGTQLQAMGRGNAQARDAALQSDGKLVVVGDVTNHPDARFAVARFNADGTTDTSFGGGTRVVAVGAGRSGGMAVAIQPDGKILVGGFSVSSNRDVMTVLRFNTDGTLDTTYGVNGAYIEAVDPLNHTSANSIALQADGKLVIAGYGNGVLKTQRVNANGTLDTTWGTSGETVVSGFRFARDMLIQPDGYVLVGGSHPNGPGAFPFAIARFTPAGVLDAGFGNAGVAHSQHSTGEVLGLALQSDGKIVAAGAGDGTSTSYGHWTFRFTATGSLDPTFGSYGDGEMVTYVGSGGNGEQAYGIALRSGGGFIVAGAASSPGTFTDTTAVAFTANGVLDTSFNGTGFRVLDLGSKSAMATSSAIQSDGKVVVAGTFPGSGDFGAGSILARYLPSGALDTTFGSNGYTLFAAQNTEAVAIQPDGRIVTGGMTFNGGDPSVAFARFNADGTPDPSFGSGGIATFPTSAAREWVKAIVIQPDGKIVGAGLIKSGALTDGRVVRILGDGTLDAGFGSGGFATLNMSSASDEFYGVALQPDGKIVVVGRAETTPPQSTMTAARLNANGTADASFGTGGMVTVGFGGDSWGYTVALQADGKIVLGGYAHPTTNNDFALARLLPNGSLDASFGAVGLVTTDFEFDQQGLRSVKILPSGKIVGAGWDVGGTFGVVQYLNDGSLDAGFGSGGHRSIAMNSNAGSDVAYSISVASDGTLYVAGDASHMFGLAILAGEAIAPPRATPSVNLASSPNPSTSGQSVTFTAAVSGSSGTPTGTVAFREGTTPISGCSAVALSGGSAACTTSSLAAGSHSINAAYSGDAAYEPATSGTITQTVNAQSADPPRLGNISTRGGVQTGENVLIGGFVIGGSTNKTVVVRARGPSLAAFGVSNPLANPQLQLVRSSDQAAIGYNDNWGDAPNAAALTASGFAPSHANESAILINLPPGAYTAIVSGVAGGTGIGIIEVFEVDHPETPLANISTRGQVLTGENVLIGGFVINGDDVRTIVVRARGPSLAAFGVANTLSNPTLTLVRSSDQVIVASNDDWATAGNAAQVIASGFAPSDTRESAILITLPPGAYTAIVGGAGGSTGVAIVEVFPTP